VTDSPEVLDALAEALELLGDENGARQVQAAATGGDLTARKLPQEPERRWDVVRERMMTKRRN
jgi:hypothetical protein